MAFARSIFTLEKLDILEGREGGGKKMSGLEEERKTTLGVNLNENKGWNI